LSNPSKGIRYYAVKTLGNLGDKKAIEPLTKIISDTNSDVREVAIEALKKLNALTQGIIIENI